MQCKSDTPSRMSNIVFVLRVQRVVITRYVVIKNIRPLGERSIYVTWVLIKQLGNRLYAKYGKRELTFGCERSLLYRATPSNRRTIHAMIPSHRLARNHASAVYIFPNFWGFAG